MEKGFVLWFTGLSGAGKSTLAQAVAQELRARGRRVEVLDGDEVRTHLSSGLGFSRADRDTNIRRIAFVAELLARHGVVAIAAAISPYRAARAEARARIGAFVEVFVDCPLEELLRRDPKGLYQRALRGELPQFTGISDPYEPPLAPELTLRTDREPPAASVARVLARLEALGYLAPARGGNGAAGGWVGPIAPHGGVLVDRQAGAAEQGRWQAEAAHLPALRLDPRAQADLELLGIGAYSPLQGFLGAADHQRVVEELRLADGTLWPLPISLRVADEQAAGLREGQAVALRDQGGRLLGILQLQERFRFDPQREARLVYGTEELAHPGVQALRESGATLLGGPITLLAPPARSAALAAYALPPRATRAEFARRGWQTVVGFQTRNPVHRAHEYLQKVALELVDGLLLHPLVGPTKADDLPAEVRLRCYQVLLAGYYPAARTLLAVLPAPMRYAGPREALLHALVRKNYGCTHFIVGRDHAGVGSYYGSYDAQRIFERFRAEELGVVPLKFEHSFYCRACGGMASGKTCPHGEEAHLVLSGSRVRALLQAGEPLPAEFTRPEVAAVLREAFLSSSPSS